ncbi:MAG TPA: DUF2330 domain-containing protein [Candidatus Saccharimonadales bacterium]|nr:DUF2330 domain-containing protein [Candidatus Saccharimonadales bacterium]
MRKFLFAGLGAAAAVVAQAGQVFACGGLVAPDGDVRLAKATTFIAWSGGIERYVTSFAYTGAVTDVGWIVPLPAVPTSIKEAGAWTLQRLEREFAPVFPGLELADAASAGAPATVIEQVQIEALDVTVLKGSGQAVIDWCTHNGFLVSPEIEDHLLRYASSSPVFMAAKYNTSLALQRHQQAGDGVPLLITMRTPHLWVPLEILATAGAPVNADLFLLTDQPLRTADGVLVTSRLTDGTTLDSAPGFTLAGAEPMNASLHHDLSIDRNMSWVPAQGYVTYLTLNAPGARVTYDLGVGTDNVIRLTSFGAPVAGLGTTGAIPVTPNPSDLLFPALLIAGTMVIVVPLSVWQLRPRRVRG